MSPHPPPLFWHPCLRPRPKTKNTTRKCSPKKKKKRVFAHKPRKFSAKFQAKKKGHDQEWQNGTIRLNRGGVEDTRLEAKDTKKSEAKPKDSLSEDRHSRGQGQECSRPRPRTKDTSASALQKERSSQKFFRRSPKKKNVFQIIRGLEASRSRPRTLPSRPRQRTSKCVLEDVLEAKDVLEDSTSAP